MELFTKTISTEQYEGVHTSIYNSDFDNFEHVKLVVDGLIGFNEKSIDPFLQGVKTKM